MLVINSKTGNVTNVKLQNSKVSQKEKKEIVEKFTASLNKMEKEWNLLLKQSKTK
jgi:hypothetical protein